METVFSTKSIKWIYQSDSDSTKPCTAASSILKKTIATKLGGFRLISHNFIVMSSYFDGPVPGSIRVPSPTTCTGTKVAANNCFHSLQQINYKYKIFLESLPSEVERCYNWRSSNCSSSDFSSAVFTSLLLIQAMPRPWIIKLSSPTQEVRSRCIMLSLYQNKALEMIYNRKHKCQDFSPVEFLNFWLDVSFNLFLLFWG